MTEVEALAAEVDRKLAGIEVHAPASLDDCEAIFALLAVTPTPQVPIEVVLRETPLSRGEHPPHVHVTVGPITRRLRIV